MMKKLMFAALAGASVFAVAPANATTQLLGSFNGSPATFTFYSSMPTGTFDDFFNFTITQNTVLANSGFQSTGRPGNLDFTAGGSALYSGTAAANQSGTGGLTFVKNFTLFPEDGNGQESGSLGSIMLAPGAYSIRVSGVVTQAPAGYNGNLSIAAVPEPATWGMMLLGFGLIGAASRRSRKVTTVLA